MRSPATTRRPCLRCQRLETGTATSSRSRSRDRFHVSNAAYVGWKKYLYPYRPTGVGPDQPGDSFRIIVLPARAEGCPLFDRPKRGRKKPPGRSALRRAARLCIGAANRNSLRSDIDSHGAPMRREAASGAAPRKARRRGAELGRGREPRLCSFSGLLSGRARSRRGSIRTRARSAREGHESKLWGLSVNRSSSVGASREKAPVQEASRGIENEWNRPR